MTPRETPSLGNMVLDLLERAKREGWTFTQHVTNLRAFEAICEATGQFVAAHVEAAIAAERHAADARVAAARDEERAAVLAFARPLRDEYAHEALTSRERSEAYEELHADGAAHGLDEVIAWLEARTTAGAATDAAAAWREAFVLALGTPMQATDHETGWLRREIASAIAKRSGLSDAELTAAWERALLAPAADGAGTGGPSDGTDL